MRPIQHHNCPHQPLLGFNDTDDFRLFCSAGGLLGGMMEQVMSQMAQGSEQSEEMLQQSLSRIQNDDRVSPIPIHISYPLPVVFSALYISRRVHNFHLKALAC